MAGFFVALTGLGFVVSGGTGLVCAVCAGRPAGSFCDPVGAREHWRGLLQVGVAMIAVGIIGQVLG